MGDDLTVLKGKIEAALFVTRSPLTIKEIADIVKFDSDEVEIALMELIHEYGFRENATSLEIDDSDGYILQVKQAYSDVVNTMMPLEISPAAVRTLSAIALKSPVLQSELIELRGSSAYEHIHELQSKNLVSKRPAGRSYMLRTTRTFKEYFRLSGDKEELDYLVQSSRNSD